MGLLYRLNAMVKCVCYMGALDPMVSYNRTDIINVVGHLRSNSVVPLVLYTVPCNDWGIDIILQVLRDNANPIENG
jgi:hypothetical protein